MRTETGAITASIRQQIRGFQERLAVAGLPACNTPAGLPGAEAIVQDAGKGEAPAGVQDIASRQEATREEAASRQEATREEATREDVDNSESIVGSEGHVLLSPTGQATGEGVMEPILDALKGPADCLRCGKQMKSLLMEGQWVGTTVDGKEHGICKECQHKRVEAMRKEQQG